jgi:membrane-associated phospholipid phosphatase
MKLPAIESKKKWVAVGIGYACFCLLYTLTGRVHLREPARLVPSAIDQAIPFIDWTVFVYLSQFVFLALCIASIKKPATINRTLYGLALASLLSFIAFIIYPTSLPRPPLTGGIAAIAYKALYLMDADTNCFPSLHVALAGLGALGVMDENRKQGIAALIWAACIAFSTITTRQHYFVDVIGGLIVMLFSRLLLRYLIRE